MTGGSIPSKTSWDDSSKTKKPEPSAPPEHYFLPRPPSKGNLVASTPARLPIVDPRAANNRLKQQQPPRRDRTKDVARYHLPFRSTLVIAKGSVLDFQGSAIVNAANEGCVGGGGVDRAIARAGGPTLERDRYQLPILARNPDIRCKVGMAVLTGPNDYGPYLPRYILHAVGPNFIKFPNNDTRGLKLLRSAYQSALDLALQHQLERVGFSLLSAGVFRGHLSLQEIFSNTVEAIRDWAEGMNKRHPNEESVGCCVKEIHLCAFTEQECYELKDVCDHILPACQF